MKNLLFKSIAFLSFLVIFSNCKKDEEPKILAPTVISESTKENIEVTFTSIKIKGNVTSNGGSEIISRGVCWSTTPSPTIDNDTTIENSNNFTSSIKNLIANTKYYFRIYAKNRAGVGYSEEQSFSTSLLENTTWDFLIIYNSTNSWHADVTFNADGTTKYDEPRDPGAFLTYGTWVFQGNTLSYDLDSSDPKNDAFQFTGTLLNNTLSGTYTFSKEPVKVWSATKY